MLNKIGQRRKELGYTLTELGRLTGLGRSNLHQLERKAIPNPMVINADRIAKALKTTIKALFID